jgi:hypothetical protein
LTAGNMMTFSGITFVPPTIFNIIDKARKVDKPSLASPLKTTPA